MLPVTLLSGFLGSGKTTLLQHILHNKKNLKCAVIVNDMASINIDATLIEKGSFLQKQEQLVKLQNGCICCTLRGDLLQEIAALAKKGEFDYLIIESTGISEPMQVAETFSMTQQDLDEMDGSLEAIADYARLDTCVTVLDASQLFGHFDSIDFLAQRFEGVEEGDERTVIDLLVDQIEFANVLIINKIELVSPTILEKIRSFLKKLNPHAKVLETSYSKVDLKEILNTNLFDFEKASMTPGWLLSLKEKHEPETIEYGISSFVYKQRRPFHPQRLFDTVQSAFMIIEETGAGEEDEDWEDMEEEVEEEEEVVEEVEEEDEEMEAEFNQQELQKRIAQRNASPFKNVLRSKGFIWIATRPKNLGEWSQSGMILTFTNAGPWFSELPQEEWSDNQAIIDQILTDFEEPFGDKRQEIVFIGQFQDGKEELIQALDSCLLTDKEMEQYKNLDFSDWKDPFEEWPLPE